ncbi:MAG: hypothetical protein H6814_04395 [Phycisphaeraceae bacterium]|nr:hypothetical protein [Phycisphaeraceae bacterium]
MHRRAALRLANRTVLAAATLSAQPPASIAANGGEDGNDVFAKAEGLITVPSFRDEWQKTLAASTGDGLCRDVDFYLISNLTPTCEYEVSAKGFAAIGFQVGWFDITGNQILIPSTDGVLSIIADANGEVRIAISGASDADFDGLDDATMQPHGTCGSYLLAIDSETDGNSTFGVAELVAATNGIRAVMESELTMSPCDALCHDVDYYRISGLNPLCDLTATLGDGPASGFRIGWIDQSGAEILTSIGSINLVADINGVVYLAVTGAGDNAVIDGLDDLSWKPHGDCGAYTLTVTERSDAGSAFGDREIVSVPNGNRIRIDAGLDPGDCSQLCHDVDFFELTGLTPLSDFDINIEAAMPGVFRLGWYDKAGALIFPGVSSISLVADVNGMAILAVTATADQDFDGFVDGTADPHGLCAEYQLVIRSPGNNGILIEDLNYDGVVDTADLGLLLAAFGSNDFIADLNGDGAVDTADLGLLLGQFGELSGA